eukprot:688848-Amphidinium_carterae.1
MHRSGTSQRWGNMKNEKSLRLLPDAFGRNRGKREPRAQMMSPFPKCPKPYKKEQQRRKKAPKGRNARTEFDERRFLEGEWEKGGMCCDSGKGRCAAYR